MTLVVNSIKDFISLAKRNENKSATVFHSAEEAEASFTFLGAPKDHMRFSFLLCGPNYSVRHSESVKKEIYETIQSNILKENIKLIEVDELKISDNQTEVAF